MIPVEVTQTPWHYTDFWDWLDHWQTLIAGFLAFVAGVGTVVAAVWAIRATRLIASEQIAASRADANMVIAATRDQTETTVRLERMRDAAKSLAAAFELQSAISRGTSAILGKRIKDISPTYTDAWNYHTRFRSAYEVAAMGRWESLSNPPDEIGKLLDPRLKEAGERVKSGREPDAVELEDIGADLRKIVHELRDRIANLSKS